MTSCTFLFRYFLSMCRRSLSTNSPTVHSHYILFVLQPTWHIYVFIESISFRFLKLTGPVPLLPDYAYGTWFTYWHQYTEDEAKGEIERWNTDDLPLDIWALDMNWRNSPHGHQDNPPYQNGDNHLYNKVR